MEGNIEWQGPVVQFAPPVCSTHIFVPNGTLVNNSNAPWPYGGTSVKAEEPENLDWLLTIGGCL